LGGQIRVSPSVGTSTKHESGRYTVLVITTGQQYHLQGGDLLIRPKKSGLGNHYGTWTSLGAVAHTTPEYGKHLGTLDEFAAGTSVRVKRVNRTFEQNYLVEVRAVADLGREYDACHANCEHDATRVHDGVPKSPTIEALTLGAVFIGLCAAVVYFRNQPQS